MPDIAEYCRELETHLCRKNGGHLIRIVGPAFERVRGWAEQGVPLTLALRGVDRCCERYHAKGPKRRPVRIEFCEADILELFDDWRRAVGVAASEGPSSASRKPSLAAHIERVIERLFVVQPSAGRSSSLAPWLEQVVRELDGLVERSRRARGAERSAIIDRLAALDREFARMAASDLDPASKDQLRREAEAELAPFVGRMSRDAKVASLDAAFDRLLRDTLKLPAIAYQ